MKKQSGFTLIELVVVMVLLGILAAVALPKFVDMSTQARQAKLNGAVGAIKSANMLAHAAYLAAGSSNSVTIEGTAYTLVNGYPPADKIADLAGLSSDDYNIGTVASGAITIGTDSTRATTCAVTYTQATTTAASSVGTPVTTGC